MTLGLGITLGAIFGLLLASAFFSGSETALTAASRAKMHALEEHGSRRARVVRFVMAVLARVTAAMQWIVRHTLRLFGASISDDAEVLSAHEELRGAIALYHKAGGMVKLNRDMLGGVLDLRELTVSDIMVHRTKMDAIDAELPTEQIVDAALKSAHTRLPLWRGEREEIVGILP